MVTLMSPIDDPGGTTLEGHTLQDPVIATAMFWMSRYTHKQVQELIEKSFSQDEILEGMVNLSNLLNLPQPMKHRDTERRPGAEAQSQSLYALLDELDAQGKIPNLVVPFGKLNLLVLNSNWVEMRRFITQFILVLINDSGNLGLVIFPDFINMCLGCF